MTNPPTNAKPLTQTQRKAMLELLNRNERRRREEIDTEVRKYVKDKEAAAATSHPTIDAHRAAWVKEKVRHNKRMNKILDAAEADGLKVIDQRGPVTTAMAAYSIALPPKQEGNNLQILMNAAVRALHEEVDEAERQILLATIGVATDLAKLTEVAPIDIAALDKKEA